MIHRFMQMVGIGRVKIVDDSKQELQILQVAEGPTGSDKSEAVTDHVPSIGHFGFSSNMPLESEVVLLRIGGDRSQSIAIGSSHRPSRPKDLGTGDSMQYRAKDGALSAYIWLKDGVIQIDAAAGDVVIQNAANVTVKATTKVRIEAPKLEVTGDIVSRAGGAEVSLNALRDAYHAHKHSGVTTGTGSSGTTDHDI